MESSGDISPAVGNTGPVSRPLIYVWVEFHKVEKQASELLTEPASLWFKTILICTDIV